MKQDTSVELVDWEVWEGKKHVCIVSQLPELWESLLTSLGFPVSIYLPSILLALGTGLL